MSALFDRNRPTDLDQDYPLAPEALEPVAETPIQPPQRAASGPVDPPKETPPPTKTPPAKGEVVDVDKTLSALARKIKKAKRNATTALLETGRHLAEAQNLLAQRGTGSFGQWCREKCDMSRSAAYRLIAVWRHFGDCPAVGQMDSDALRMLAAAPPAAIADAIDFADSGSRVTPEVAKQFIKEHAEPLARRPMPAPIFIETPSAMVIIRPKVEGVIAETVLRQAIEQSQKSRHAA